MKDCRACICFKDGHCDNYLCRNQSEYDEYIRKKDGNMQEVRGADHLDQDAEEERLDPVQ